jgi:F-type H+-transporting ATPase subunit delta
VRPDAIARRYARALLELAESAGIVDQIGAALVTVDGLLADPRVARVLGAPLARERKEEVLRSLVEAIDAPPLLRDFLRLLVERDRLDHAPAIRTSYETFVDQRRNRTRAAVRTATPLPEEAVNEIVRVFGNVTGKQVLPEVRVEPELIAGVVVEIEGRVYDGSVRTQLGKLRQQMAAAS